MRRHLPLLCAALIVGGPTWGCAGEVVTRDARPSGDGIVLEDSGQQADGGSCARGTYFQGTCYFNTGIGSMDYSTAKGLCTAAGAEPASIHSQELNALIYNMMLKIRDGMWIGLKRSGSSYAWEDGSALDYENWASGEPDDNDCVYMVGPWADQSKQGKWADRGCSGRFEDIICQIKP